MNKVETAVIKLQEVKPAAYNPRAELTAQDLEYQALRGSMQENGLVLPLIVNLRDNTLISGHQRFNVLLADVREKVGFTQLLVCEELKRRLFS